MNNNENIRLVTLLRNYISTTGTTVSQISRETGIHKNILSNLIGENQKQFNITTFTKLLQWLLTSPEDSIVVQDDADTAGDTANKQQPRTRITHPGKLVELSPRMQSLVNRQKGNK